MGKTATPLRVGFLAFPGVTALDFVGPMEAFASAGVVDAAGRKTPGYELAVIGTVRKSFEAESGLTVQPRYTLESAPPLDTLVIPGGSGLRQAGVSERVARWITERAPRMRRIASVCTGIYGLAASGLLDGRRATTHWAFAEDVRQRFPKVELDANPLYVKDGKFYTSAGVTAGIDLSLALIEEDYGPTVALNVARELVVYLKRSGDQTQYSEPLRFQARTRDRFADLVPWIAANLHQPLSVETLAQRARLGARHFSRRFAAAFAMSPAAFVEQHRLDEARRRLTGSRASVETIAASVGFRSADSFRRAFERKFGVTPTGYRQRFTALPAASAR